MRAHILFGFLSLAGTIACGSEDRGDGRKGTSAGNPGGPNAFGNNASGPSFGENAGSGPSFGENAGSGPSFGESVTGSATATAEPPLPCSKSIACPSSSVCTSSSSTLGFCIRLCTTKSVSAVEAGLCPSGLFCVSGNTTTGGCFQSCTTTSDCPAIAGLTADCTKHPTGARFCVWEGTSTTETAPPASSGG